MPNQVQNVSGINTPIAPIETQIQTSEIEEKIATGGVAEKKPQSDINNYSSILTMEQQELPEDISPNNPFLMPPKSLEVPLPEPQTSLSAQNRQIEDSLNVTAGPIGANAENAQQQQQNSNGQSGYNNINISSVNAFNSDWSNFTDMEASKLLEGLDPQVANALKLVLGNIKAEINGVNNQSDPDSLQRAYKDTSAQASGVGMTPEQEQALIIELQSKGMSMASIDEFLAKGYSLTEIKYIADIKGPSVREVDQGVQEFRFAGNYLAIIAKVLALLNMLKGLMATIEGDMLKLQIDAEKGNMKAQMDVMMKKLKESFLEHQKAERLKDMDSASAKWIMFTIQIVTTVVMIVAAIALTVLTAGVLGPIALGIIITVLAVSTAVTAATMTLQFLQMVKVDVIKELVLACGGTEDDVWIAKLVIALVVLAVCVTMVVVGAGVASYAAGMTLSNTVGMMTMAGIMMTATIAPQLMAYSNVVFELTYRIAVACGMSEEDAAILAMVLTIVAMILVMILSLVLAASAAGIMMKLNPSLAGLRVADAARTSTNVSDDAMNASQKIETSFNTTGRVEGLLGRSANKLGLYKHYGGRSGAQIREGAEVYDPKAAAPQGAQDAPEGQNVGVTPQQKLDANQAATMQRLKDQLQRLQNIFAVKGWKDAAMESLVVIQEICMAIQAVSSIVQGVAMIERGKLILEQADLQYKMAVMQTMLEFLKATNPMYDRAIDAILDDMQNGMMKLATELHKIFESAVSAASRSSTARNNAIKS